MHHSRGLRLELIKSGTANDDAVAIVDKLKSSTSFEDLVLCELPEKQFAILKYALKLTQTPGDIDAEDVTLLRECGLNDRAIHDVCAITAYFAFVNRIADGLGVELEETDR